MSADGPVPGLAGLSHIGIAVPDLAAATARLSALLGVVPGPVHENPAQGVRMVWLDLPGLRLELLTATDPQGPLGRFLARNPKGGLHHVSLAVADIEAAADAFAARGAPGLGQPAPNVAGRRMLFLDPRGVEGVLVELEETAREPAGGAAD